MSNIFLNIPVPANGPGAAVDTSMMGATKTFVVGGGFKGSLTLEFAVDVAGTLWAPVPNGSFVGNPGRVTIDLATHWVRANTTSYSGAANVDVGAPDINNTAKFTQLTAAPVDISEFPAFKTVVATKGNVEISEDGVSWSQVFSFNKQGSESATIIGQFARLVGGGTAWMGASEQGSEAGATDAAPVLTIVYRPLNPGGSVDNVYVTWPEVYAAIESVRDRGRILLEIDSRYSQPVPAMIPPGVWNFAGVAITSPTTFADGAPESPSRLEFEDGCSIVMSGPEPGSDQEWLQLRGDFLQIIFNGHTIENGGTGITPLLGINVIFLGSVTFIGNTDPLAAPMLKSVGFLGSVVMNGSGNSIGLLVFPGSDPVSPAPVWDIAGGGVAAVIMAGNIYDNAITDSEGGGFIAMQLQDDSAMGGAIGVEFEEDGVAPTYTWPGINLPENGSFIDMKSHHRDRLLFRSSANVYGFGPPQINVTQSPYDAAYNECCVVNTDDYSGDGDRFLKIDATTMELQDDTFPFGQMSVGQSVTIAGSTTLANNGTFVVTFVSGSGFRIRYTNAAGVAEDFEGTWTFPGGDVVVNAPRAYPANGERVVVKNHAGPNDVFFTATGFDNVDGNPTGTVAPNETKTWADDGRFSWLLIGHAVLIAP